MSSQAERELDDGPLYEEIELFADLVLAASGVTRHMTEREVDRILQAHQPPGDRSTPRTAHALPAGLRSLNRPPGAKRLGRCP